MRISDWSSDVCSSDLYFGWEYADPIFGGGVAVYILYNAYLILRDALDMLMDRELQEAERRRIREIVAAHPEVRDLHDLRTRQAGQTCFIQFHLELDGRSEEHTSELQSLMRISYA